MAKTTAKPVLRRPSYDTRLKERAARKKTEQTGKSQTHSHPFPKPDQPIRRTHLNFHRDSTPYTTPRQNPGTISRLCFSSINMKQLSLRNESTSSLEPPSAGKRFKGRAFLFKRLNHACMHCPLDKAGTIVCHIQVQAYEYPLDPSATRLADELANCLASSMDNVASHISFAAASFGPLG